MSTIDPATGFPVQDKKRSGCKQGCIIAAIAGFAIAVAVIVVVAMSWRGWVAGGLTAATTQMVNDSNLPQDQRQQIIAKVNTVAADFKAGKISTTQLGGVMQSIVQGPLMPMMVTYAVHQQYVANSPDFKPEEKTAAKRTLDRFARGVFERKIPQSVVNQVAAPVADVGPNNSIRLRSPNQVTPDQVRQFLANAKAEADKAQIPDEPFQPNIAAELDKAIDEGLKSGGGGR